MMNTMTNNPVTLIYNEMQNGLDILTALDKVSAQYPQAFPQARIVQAKMLLGGNYQGNLSQTVQNMARERGLTVENVLRSIGVQLPSQIK